MRQDSIRLVEIKFNGISIGEGYGWDGQIIFDKRIPVEDRNQLLQVLLSKIDALDSKEMIVDFGPVTLDTKLGDLSSPCVCAIKYNAEAHIRVYPYDRDYLMEAKWQPETDVCDRYPEGEFTFETTIK